MDMLLLFAGDKIKQQTKIKFRLSLALNQYLIVLMGVLQHHKTDLNLNAD